MRRSYVGCWYAWQPCKLGKDIDIEKVNAVIQDPGPGFLGGIPHRFSRRCGPQKHVAGINCSHNQTLMVHNPPISPLDWWLSETVSNMHSDDSQEGGTLRVGKRGSVQIQQAHYCRERNSSQDACSAKLVRTRHQRRYLLGLTNVEPRIGSSTGTGSSFLDMFPSQRRQMKMKSSECGQSTTTKRSRVAWSEFRMRAHACIECPEKVGLDGDGLQNAWICFGSQLPYYGSHHLQPLQTKSGKGSQCYCRHFTNTQDIEGRKD